MKQNIMILATLCVVSLVSVIWALGRVSVWIVHHDHIWAEMDAGGAGSEHWIAEVFNVAHWLHLPAIVAVVGGVFLFLLWRTLTKHNAA